MEFDFAERGDAAHLEEALARARKIGSVDPILRVTIGRAYLPDGDVSSAIAAFERYSGQIPPRARKQFHFRPWEMAGEDEHPVEAHRTFTFERDYSPEDCRETIIDNVPINRAIVDAWAARRSD